MDSIFAVERLLLGHHASASISIQGLQKLFTSRNSTIIKQPATTVCLQLGPLSSCYDYQQFGNLPSLLEDRPYLSINHQHLVVHHQIFNELVQFAFSCNDPIQYIFVYGASLELVKYLANLIVFIGGLFVYHKAPIHHWITVFKHLELDEIVLPVQLAELLKSIRIHVCNGEAHVCFEPTSWFMDHVSAINDTWYYPSLETIATQEPVTSFRSDHIMLLLRRRDNIYSTFVALCATTKVDFGDIFRDLISKGECHVTSLRTIHIHLGNIERPHLDKIDSGSQKSLDTSNGFGEEPRCAIFLH